MMALHSCFSLSSSCGNWLISCIRVLIVAIVQKRVTLDYAERMDPGGGVLFFCPLVCARNWANRSGYRIRTLLGRPGRYPGLRESAAHVSGRTMADIRQRRGAAVSSGFGCSDTSTLLVQGPGGTNFEAVHTIKPDPQMIGNGMKPISWSPERHLLA